MIDVLKSVMAAPLGTLLILAGVAFLAVAVVGNISGKIEPGPVGRIGAAFAGTVLLLVGLIVQWPERRSVEPVTPLPASNGRNPKFPIYQPPRHRRQAALRVCKMCGIPQYPPISLRLPPILQGRPS